MGIWADGLCKLYTGRPNSYQELPDRPEGRLRPTCFLGPCLQVGGSRGPPIWPKARREDPWATKKAPCSNDGHGAFH